MQQSGEDLPGPSPKEIARRRPWASAHAGVPVTKSAHVIAARLRERIVRGEVAEGDPLPVESQLEAEFGASRPVLREALRILENEGLVETRRGKGGGPRVRHPSLASAAQAVGVHLQLRDVSVRDVWDAYTDIVTAALRRLADRSAGLADRSAGLADRSAGLADRSAGLADRSAGLADQSSDLETLRLEVDELQSLVGDADGFYGQIVATTEESVRLAGNTTATILVGALRQIILAELGFLTRTNRDRGPQGGEISEQSQQAVVRAWRSILHHLGANRGDAAAAAYQGVAELIRIGVVRESGDRSVIDIFPWFVPRQDSSVTIGETAIDRPRPASPDAPAKPRPRNPARSDPALEQ